MDINNLCSLINNASLCNLGDINIPTTKKCLKLLELLYKEGYIRGYLHNKTRTTVYLKFTGSVRKPVIKHMQLISTNSREVFANVKTLSKLVHSQETFILSTNRGFCTIKEALKKNLGGLVICKII